MCGSLNASAIQFNINVLNNEFFNFNYAFYKKNIAEFDFFDSSLNSPLAECVFSLSLIFFQHFQWAYSNFSCNIYNVKMLKMKNK